MDVNVRRFRDADAPKLAEWLDQLAMAEEVCTAARLVHLWRTTPRRHRPLWLVAVRDGDPVALGRDESAVFDSLPGLRRTWVGVRPDCRHRGIGARLWEKIEAHAREVGGRTLRSWAVSEPPDGERFLLARGFARTRRELQSWVDPTELDAGQLERRRAEARGRGLRVATLRELLPEAEPAVRKLFLGADQDSPGHTPGRRPLAASTFRRAMLGNPTLDRDLSTVVLHGDQPVALCWLKGDRRAGRYGVEFTGTAPAWRGQGLATLAKMAALDLAARAGIRWVGTSNDENNPSMLAVNRRLGHRPLSDLVIYERSVLRSPSTE